MSKKQKIYPWVVDVSMGLLTAVVVDTFLTLMGYFLLPLVKSMHVSLSVVSLFYSAVVIAMAATFPIAGRLVTKVKLNVLTVGSVIIAAASAFVLSKITNLALFFIMAILVGICSGFAGLVVQGIVINNWFEKKKSLAFSTASWVDTLYVFIMTPIVSILVNKVSWQTGFYCLALAILIVGLPSALLAKFKPEDIGLLPYGAKSEAEVKEIKKENTEKNEGPHFTTKQIVLSGTFVVCFFFAICIQITSNMNQLFPTFAEEYKLGLFAVTAMPMALSLADLVLTPAFGWSCDKFGARKAIPFWIVIAICSLIILGLAATIKSPILAVIGAGLSDTFTMFLGSGQEIFAREQFGKAFNQAFSLITSITYILGAFAIPLLSWIYETSGSFITVLTFCGVLGILMIIINFIGKKHVFNAEKANN